MAGGEKEIAGAIPVKWAQMKQGKEKPGVQTGKIQENDALRGHSIFVFMRRVPSRKALEDQRGV
jgi:hypothetical protein